MVQENGADKMMFGEIVMKENDQADLKQTMDNAIPVTPDTIDENDLPTPFIYKAVAAIALIVPFGFFIDEGQKFFIGLGWEYIGKMTVLIGLILYIIFVGKLARKLKDWHEARQA
jgi:hypothetical protein